MLNGEQTVLFPPAFLFTSLNIRHAKVFWLVTILTWLSFSWRPSVGQITKGTSVFPLLEQAVRVGIIVATRLARIMFLFMITFVLAVMFFI